VQTIKMAIQNSFHHLYEKTRCVHSVECVSATLLPVNVTQIRQQKFHTLLVHSSFEVTSQSGKQGCQLFTLSKATGDGQIFALQ